MTSLGISGFLPYLSVSLAKAESSTTQNQDLVSRDFESATGLGM